MPPITSFSFVFLHIAGAVCLLLWGTRMVKRGFTRAYSSSLGAIVSSGTRNRFTASLSGFAITALLQSSSAATLLLLSFVQRHSISLTASLAFVIGADISTTIVAQILTFDLSWLSPALLVIGIAGHMKYEHAGRIRHVFRIFIGIGLILLALSLIRSASAPLTASETLPLILAPLHSDPVAAIIFAAILTWVIHSSLAAILLFAVLASNQIIDLPLGYLLVLGANIGGAFVAFIASYSEGVMARRVTVGNIIMRTIGVILFYIFTHQLLQQLESFSMDTARLLVTMHMLFNILLALLFLPIVGYLAKLCCLIYPDTIADDVGDNTPIYLDDKALDTPVHALALATRETLRMSEEVEEMLEQTINCFKQNTVGLAQQIKAKDDKVDDLYQAIKFYLAKLAQRDLDPKEADRYMQILTFSTNLEHVGDIIEKSLMELARKKVKAGERFSGEGWAEIKSFHAEVLVNMRSSQTIFLSEDSKLARQLIDSKKDILESEQRTSVYHFERLGQGQPETLATSSLHLDIIRDYRRINSYITTVAYPILENAAKQEKKKGKKKNK